MIGDELRRVVERHWEHYSECASVHWSAVESDGGLNCEASPILQEIVGGPEDGSRIWSAFEFDLTAFLAEPNLDVEEITIESLMVAFIRRPGVSIRGHFNAWFKARFDWLLPAEYTNVAGSGTFRIGAIDDPAENGQRALRIVKDSTKNYWVEFRKAFTTNKWAMNGVMVIWPGTRGPSVDCAVAIPLPTTLETATRLATVIDFALLDSTLRFMVVRISGKNGRDARHVYVTLLQRRCRSRQR